MTSSGLLTKDGTVMIRISRTVTSATDSEQTKPAIAIRSPRIMTNELPQLHRALRSLILHSYRCQRIARPKTQEVTPREPCVAHPKISALMSMKISLYIGRG